VQCDIYIYIYIYVIRRLKDEQGSGHLNLTVLWLQHLKCQTLNPLTPELNPSAQHCLESFFTGDFAS
jgi:hypothetical protein